MCVASGPEKFSWEVGNYDVLLNTNTPVMLTWSYVLQFLFGLFPMYLYLQKTIRNASLLQIQFT